MRDGIGEFDASVVISRQDAYVSPLIDLFAPLLRSMTGVSASRGLTDATGDCLQSHRCFLFVATAF